MARVDDATRARCVRDYLERSEAPMCVCAACGARDPFDLCQKSVPLLELPDAHWLRADGGALARLHAAPDLQLLRLRPDGTYATEARGSRAPGVFDFLKSATCFGGHQPGLAKPAVGAWT